MSDVASTTAALLRQFLGTGLPIGLCGWGGSTAGPHQDDPRLGDTVDKRAEALTALAGAGHVRVWRLYLAGGALAFEANRMGVGQVLAMRTIVDGRSAMPPTRSFLSAVAR